MDQAEAQAAAMNSTSFKSRSETFRSETRYASVSSSISAALDRIASPENVAHVLRSAAHAAAKVMYAELQVKVPVKKGVLRDSLFRWFDTKRSTPTKQIYLVGPNKRVAGHWANVEFGHFRYNRYAGNGKWRKSLLDKGAKAGKTKSVKGQWHGGPGALEQPKWVVPHPYLRPAWEAQKKNVVVAMRKRASVRLREVMSGKLWAAES